MRCCLLPVAQQVYRGTPGHPGAGVSACLHDHQAMDVDHALREGV